MFDRNLSSFSSTGSNFFGSGSVTARKGTAGIKFQATPVYDTYPKQKICTITAMVSFKDKSIDELRFEDYEDNKKSSATSVASTFSSFGTPALSTITTTTTASLWNFGSSVQTTKPSTGFASSFFGTGSIFGNPETTKTSAFGTLKSSSIFQSQPQASTFLTSGSSTLNTSVNAEKTDFHAVLQRHDEHSKYLQRQMLLQLTYTPYPRPSRFARELMDKHAQKISEEDQPKEKVVEISGTTNETTTYPYQLCDPKPIEHLSNHTVRFLNDSLDETIYALILPELQEVYNDVFKKKRRNKILKGKFNPHTISTRPGYSIRPSLAYLKLNSVTRRCVVENFGVYREGYGSIIWPGLTDITDLNIDNNVFIGRSYVIVYGDQYTPKPQRGRELNRPAEINLYQVFEDDLSTDVELGKYLESIGTDLLSYDFLSGYLSFMVAGF
ncbi:hypothetical protein ACOME3_003782 [Neoechinorhynchus agilis]